MGHVLAPPARLRAPGRVDSRLGRAVCSDLIRQGKPDRGRKENAMSMLRRGALVIGVLAGIALVVSSAVPAFAGGRVFFGVGLGFPFFPIRTRTLRTPTPPTPRRSSCRPRPRRMPSRNLRRRLSPSTGTTAPPRRRTTRTSRTARPAGSRSCRKQVRPLRRRADPSRSRSRSLPARQGARVAPPGRPERTA